MSKLVLVTGGTRGIGAAISIAFKAAGYKVAAIYNRNQEQAEEFSKQTNISVYKWDVSNYQQCLDGVARIEGELGFADILINNAGITKDAFFHKMTEDQWLDVISTNLNSCFNMTRAVIGGMRERRFGRIINISSVNGQKGQRGQTNYAAAKSGLLGLTKSLADETASLGITVNAIAPGYIETDMVKAINPEVLEKIVKTIPVGRLGKVEEVANTALFLAREDMGFITGATVSINGGQHFV